MSDFRFRFEWEDSPRARAPELDATWARLEIYVKEEPITRVEARRTQSVRTGIYIPLFPIAEWMVANWWFLWEEWRTNAPRSRHSLLAAREGFVLPDLNFSPTETKVELVWRPTGSAFSTGDPADVLFLSGGSSILPKAAVKEELSRLVEAVIERLSSKQVHNTNLAREWRAILASERDPEQKDFCEKAARLGCDPFDVSESIAGQIEHIGVLLPEPLVEDFCDAIPLSQLASGAEALRTFIDTASATAPDEGRWRELRTELLPRGTDAPWREGYNRARDLRAYLGSTGPIIGGFDAFLRREFGSLQIAEFEVAARIDAIAAPTRTEAPLFGLRSRLREESRRFILCRALSDHLISRSPSLVTRGSTERQQRNRAFAAEFLAPADSLKQRIARDNVGEEDLEELSEEFQVSDLVIRHQIQNHGLARLSA